MNRARSWSRRLSGLGLALGLAGCAGAPARETPPKGPTLLVTAGDVPPAARKAALATLRAEGVEVQEATVYRALVPTDFVTFVFGAPPPPGWPAALRADWERAHAACRDRVGERVAPGQERWHILARTACGLQLYRSLWGRYLQSLGNPQVIELAAVDGTLSMSRYRPPVLEGVRLEPVPVGSAEEMPALATELARSLLRGAGKTYTYAPFPELPAPPVPVAPAVAELKAPLELPPLSPARRCAALPSALQVRPETALGATVVQRYARTVPGATARPWRCELRMHEGPLRLKGSGAGPENTTQALLDCGTHQLRAFGPTERMSLDALVDALSGQLVQAALLSACPP